MTALTQERLKDVLYYNPDTGEFTWVKTNPKRKYQLGTIAGAINNDGYKQIKIDKRCYLGHRLAWLYMYSSWPEQTIDHINLDKLDNRITNLRACSISENRCNTKVVSNSTSGIKGISFTTKRAGTSGEYSSVTASIMLNGITYSKSMKYIDELHKETNIKTLVAWLQEAREQLHREFTNHGV